MTWKPNTKPLTGDDIVCARMATALTDDEFFGRKRRYFNYPNQSEMAARLGVTPRTYHRYEKIGARGTRAALLRHYFETGEDISSTDAPLLYWEQLANYCGTYTNALAFIGMHKSARAVAQWHDAGVVRSRVGAGRLLKICWERLELESIEPVRRRAMKINWPMIKQIKQMHQQNIPTIEIAKALGVSVTSVRKYR